jgi:hypothetical protein
MSTMATVRAETAILALTAEQGRLLDRLAAICPDHTRCAACGDTMCEPCDLGGGASRCPHGDPICRDCDPTDRCGDCYVEYRESLPDRARPGVWF